MPISGEVFIIIPIYAEAEILKLTNVNGSWQVQNITLGQFNAANPSFLNDGIVGYGDFNGDGVKDLSISLGTSAGNQTIRLVGSTYTFNFYDLLSSGNPLTKYTYDALGRLIKVHQGQKLDVQYNYDAAGNRDTVIKP